MPHTAYDVVMKQNDRLPLLRTKLMDVEGTIQDLSFASAVVLHLRRIGDEDTLLGGPCIVEVPAVDGIVRYEWEAADTLAAGLYYGEFQVTIDGKTMTFPNGRNFTLKVRPQLA